MDSSGGMDAPGRYAIALEEARRTFDEQLGQFARVRSAMGSLLGYGGISFSVLVVQPGQLAGPHQRALIIGASITFVALCVCVALGLWPRLIEPSPSPRDLVRWIDVDGVTPDEASRHLAESLNNAFDHNAGILTLKARLNMASIACFVLTIILLALRMIGL